MHYIYIYINKLDGKIYVGQTQDLKSRDKSHIYNKSNLHIDNAIRKYGRNNFDYFILTTADNIESANQKEIFWISEMRRLFGDKMIYNKSNGGEASMRGLKHSDNTKKKMSDSKVGEKNPNYGKRFPGRTNSGCFKPGHKVHHNHKGKTWKLINGKRVWITIKPCST